MSCRSDKWLVDVGSSTLARLGNDIATFPSPTIGFNVATTASRLRIVTKSLRNRVRVAHALPDCSCLSVGKQWLRVLQDSYMSWTMLEFDD